MDQNPGLLKTSFVLHKILILSLRFLPYPLIHLSMHPGVCVGWGGGFSMLQTTAATLSASFGVAFFSCS